MKYVWFSYLEVGGLVFDAGWWSVLFGDGGRTASHSKEEDF